MVPAFSSSEAVAVAQFAALAAAASSLAIFVLMFAHRGLRRLRERRLGPRLARWRADLHAAIDGAARRPLGPVPDASLPDFLRLWNYLRESVRGEAGDSLAQLLREGDLVPRIRSLAAGRSLHHRLVAITALGHLRDAESREALEDLANKPDPVLSLAAIRALVRIDPERALGRLLGLAIRREDWPLASLGAALQEAGPDLVTPAMVRLLAAPPATGLDRLVRLARFAHRPDITAAMRERLAGASAPEVIGAALDFVEDDRDLPRVRAAASHPAWHVRMAAANALGRIGTVDDLAVLLMLAEDRSWWVRHRAASAILRLPGLGRAEVEAIRASARDRFAADALAQAIAEAAP